LKRPNDSVDTLPIWMEFEVTPVWSEKALDGIGREAVPELDDPPAAVVVVDDELVELQAAAPSPMAKTIASAVVRRFQVPERNAPP
jgi:hypothetical protein